MVALCSVKGSNREEAYAIVQESAHTAWNKPGGNFQDLISKDPRVTQKLSPAELEVCFDPQQHLQHLEEVYQRLGI
jgi:adenylosuccinate lyase